MLTGEQRDKLIKQAEHELEAGETVLHATFGAIQVPHKRRRDRTRGRYTSVLATDRRLLLYRKKLTGHEVRSVPYSQIRSVDHGKGIATGELELSVSDRDPVRITSMPKDDVDVFVDLINERGQT